MTAATPVVATYSGALDDSSGFMQTLADSATTEIIDEIVSLPL